MENLHELPLLEGRRPPHPVLYALLYVPFGASSGFVTVALAFLATKNGLTVEQGAGLVAASLFPNVWKFFWAPVADKTLGTRKWYLLSTLSVAISMGIMCVVPLGPATLPLMTGLILANSFGATFIGFAVESCVAHLTPATNRGSVSGWFQAGNLGGAGIGGGFGLWLLNTMPSPWVAGVIISLVTLLCCIPIAFIPNVPAVKSGGSVLAAVKHVGVDMWQVVKSRNGILCSVLCIVPIGTGAASGVLAQAEVAKFWGAGDHEVEIVQGFLTGLVSMFGCLAGGAVCHRWLNGRVAYAVFGAMMAATTAVWAVAPSTVEVFIGLNMVYAFITGLCYAAFSAFVLDAIGAGHAATKYNGFASLSNAPIWYTGLALAVAETKWGPRGMLTAESVMGVVGVVVFAIAMLAVGRAKTPAPAVSASA